MMNEKRIAEELGNLAFLIGSKKFTADEIDEIAHDFAVFCTGDKDLALADLKRRETPSDFDLDDDGEYRDAYDTSMNLKKGFITVMRKYLK